MFWLCSNYVSTAIELCFKIFVRNCVRFDFLDLCFAFVLDICFHFPKRYWLSFEFLDLFFDSLDQNRAFFYFVLGLCFDYLDRNSKNPFRPNPGKFKWAVTLVSGVDWSTWFKTLFWSLKENTPSLFSPSISEVKILLFILRVLYFL